jgi:hypothetical protein
MVHWQQAMQFQVVEMPAECVGSQAQQLPTGLSADHFSASASAEQQLQAYAYGTAQVCEGLLVTHQLLHGT